jgi:hypothetical protein
VLGAALSAKARSRVATLACALAYTVGTAAALGSTGALGTAAALGTTAELGITGGLGATAALGATAGFGMTSGLRMTAARGTVPGNAFPAGSAAPGFSRKGSLAPRVVLARYARALARLKHPPTLAFDYAVEQLGLRNMEQTHRVYRSGRSERDETLIVDGYPLQRPAIRIFANRTYRYDVSGVAPRAPRYRFVSTGAISRGSSSFDYVFKTVPLGAASFAVSEVVIDGTRFLPSRIRFKIAAAGARGSGQLTYEAVDGYWVVRQALVDARLPNGSTAHERIAWSDYSFPSSLPESTFTPPRARALVPIAAEPLPAPASDLPAEP